MMSELQFDPARTVALTLDMQVGVVSTYVKDDSLIPRAAGLLDAARRARLPVVHVKVAFRRGVPEASPRNMFVSAVKASAPHQRFFHDASGAIHPDLFREPDGDVVVTKSRVSAFSDTDLETLLRAGDCNTLLLFGIATTGAVLATALQAADRDYRVVIVRDCCADLDTALHNDLFDRFFPRQTTVVNASTVTAALGAAS